MTIMGRNKGLRKRSIGRSHVTRSDFFWPLAVIAALTLLVMTMGIHFAVRAFDKASEQREQTLAQNGITLRIQEVAQMIVPQADWDDAVRYLDNKFDEAWADANIGKYLNQTNGFDRSFVLDAADRPIFASINGERTALTSFDRIAPLAAPLVRSVREQEARRGPIKAVQTSGMISRPIQANALKILGGKMAIMTATLVQPDFGTAMPKGPRSPVVVTTMAVGPEFLELFSKRFLFDGVHVRALDQRPIAGETEIAAKDGDGRVIAHFAWRPLNPGYAMLRQLLPPIGLVCAVLGLVALTQLRRIAHFADALIDREAQSRALAYYDPLTELPNRLYFREQLALEIAGIGEDVRSLAILCISFEGLRDVAEQYGVAASDEFLKVAARRLSAVCRDDVVLARISEEGFAILSLGAGLREARVLGQRLRKAMDTPLALESGRVELPCNVTTRVITDSDVDPADALRQAEIALSYGQDGDNSAVAAI